MNILNYLNEHLLLLDGGSGTLLQAAGLPAGMSPAVWNLENPEAIRKLHKDYYEAGSNVVCTNTFGANPLHFSEAELDRTIAAALSHAHWARENSAGRQEKFVALDIGPSGRLLKPFGDLDLEEAVALFAAVVKRGAREGADLVFIETFNDSYETKAALLAAKENCDLPVFVSNAYGADGRLMTGASPAAMAAMLEGMGADALGCNCSLGPVQLTPIVEELLANASVPVLVKPNAGLPRLEEGKTVYDIDHTQFAAVMAGFADKGAAILGGCCGTSPEYIQSLRKATEGKAPAARADKGLTVASSYAKALAFGDKPVLIGERINPTGKKRLQQALKENDMAYVLQQAMDQKEQGAHALDVNVGLPGLPEGELLTAAVTELQAVTDLPLQIDSADPLAMEGAMRRYNGKPLVNSVNGKQESMDAVFPLVKKYGGVLVALTLDEAGIPDTADGRFAIAERIVNKAEAFGISRKNLLFDPLAMAISAAPGAAMVAAETIERIEKELNCRTVLGLSNISFGLPGRDILNGAFFSMALERGLSAAIVNPASRELMKAYKSHLALHGLDPAFAGFMELAEKEAAQTAAGAVAAGGTGSAALGAGTAVGEGIDPGANAAGSARSGLKYAVEKGLKEKAGEEAALLLESRAPLSIIEEEIIPALNSVGAGFEEKRIYLPQLLMSAEAAGAAFEKVKTAMARQPEEEQTKKCSFVLATVKGDIHDIGKNIVRLLLENYGFAVEDLGRDVPPQAVLDAVLRLKAPLCGLSALMTTTVPSMEETVALLKEKAPFCRVVVGGAVLTAEYAEKMGADFYAKDAMETVRYGEEVSKGLVMPAASEQKKR